MVTIQKYVFPLLFKTPLYLTKQKIAPHHIRQYFYRTVNEFALQPRWRSTVFCVDTGRALRLDRAANLGHKYSEFASQSAFFLTLSNFRSGDEKPLSTAGLTHETGSICSRCI